MSRQVMQHLIGDKLPVIKTEKNEVLGSRAYTPEQVKVIAEHQNERNALATQLSYASGLRAHELLTLKPANEQPANIRETHELKFSQREGEIYTVVGKGGLIREVLIPSKLATKLEQYKLNEPVKITDRGIYYQQRQVIALLIGAEGLTD
jgi:integrase